MGWLPYITMFLLMMIGMMLIFIILLQRGRGGGLAGALGGMGGQSAFGTKAGDMFTRITIGLAAVWMIVAVGNIYALQYTGKLYDGGSEAVKDAGSVETDGKKDGESDLDDAAKNAAHSLMNLDGKKDDAATEDKAPAGETKPEDKKADEAAAPKKKTEEPKTEPAKDDAAKTEEKTEKPAEPAAKPEDKKPE